MTNPETILIVEDDAGCSDVLSFALTKKGFKVLTASNGLKALEMLAICERPDYIFLDLIMPVMNGYQLLEILKQDPDLSSIPVVLISAAESDRGIQGVSAYLENPYLFTDVLDLIKNRSFCA